MFPIGLAPRCSALQRMGQITQGRTILTAAAFRPEDREEAVEISWEILFSSHRIPGPAIHIVQSSMGKIIYIYM